MSCETVTGFHEQNDNDAGGGPSRIGTVPKSPMGRRST